MRPYLKNRLKTKNWRCVSSGKALPSKCKALSSIPSNIEGVREREREREPAIHFIQFKSPTGKFCEVDIKI
jgi:hypothetical protein